MPDEFDPIEKREASGPKAVPKGPPAASAPAPLPPRGAGFDYKSILQNMIQQGASDVHLKVGRPPTLRIDGHMVSLEMPALTQEDLRSLAEQIMAPKNIKEFSEQKESDFALAVPGVGRFRVNAYQQRGTIAYAMRTVPFQAKTIAELNLPEAVERIALMPRGLILVTGITGSGKSTALASMLHYINQNRHANIITIEDPIEFLHRDIKSSINQREVGTDTNSFAQALRRVLRQDPDILLVGEIRDLETLDTALKAAETGHLVFSTLHTTDATQTINRILSFYPPHQQTDVRYMLSNALRAIISLRLVRRADKKGRVPAAEILVNTEAVREQIRDLTKSLNIPQLIKEGAVPYGMQSFDQSLMNWYHKGVISYDDALFAATNPAEFSLRLQGIAASSDTSWDTVKQEVT
ncbi:MAG TPA: type IV pilus twitching motility protein PilT [Gemmatimonadaceae bacterium]|jgi:twitching motility protein PilT|nr:type IV pilus twitching motility protein PilT [Gemmatimonadaceae bacterium]